jgi:hypothetical protein
MLTTTYFQLLRFSATVAGSLRNRLATARSDERGEIPAQVAWIAGMVVIALAVLAIIAAITKSQASSIVLH